MSNFSPNQALSGLLEFLGDVVARYERQRYAIEAGAPKDSLRVLINACGLNQEDLSVIVPQSNLSAIRAGKCKISATLAGKFDKFLGVSPPLFVPP